MSAKPIRILVTAIGGDLGQSIAKALRLSREVVEVHGCDSDVNGIGSAFADQFQSVPPANAGANYLEALNNVCRAFRIQAVVPGSEPEIAVLSKADPAMRLPCGAVIVCQPASWIETYGDKLNCLCALREPLNAPIALPLFADGTCPEAVAGLIERSGFPVVVKARRGSGSRMIHIVRDSGQLTRSLEEIPAPLVQQYLDDSGGEFTVGVFVGSMFKAAIAFRRECGIGGCSWSAEVDHDPEALQYAWRVARASGLRGSANIQLRKTAQGVRLLEINPRFSSLAAVRAFCGFTDVIWSVAAALQRKVSPPQEPFKRVRFRRFLHELVDTGDGFEALSEWCPRQRLSNLRDFGIQDSENTELPQSGSESASRASD